MPARNSCLLARRGGCRSKLFRQPEATGMPNAGSTHRCIEDDSVEAGRTANECRGDAGLPPFHLRPCQLCEQGGMHSQHWITRPLHGCDVEEAIATLLCNNVFTKRGSTREPAGLSSCACVFGMTSGKASLSGEPSVTVSQRSTSTGGWRRTAKKKSGRLSVTMR